MNGCLCPVIHCFLPGATLQYTFTLVEASCTSNCQLLNFTSSTTTGIFTGLKHSTKVRQTSRALGA